MEKRVSEIDLAFSFLGILCGIASFYIKNVYLAFLVAILVYVASFSIVRALKLVGRSTKIFIETFLPFFGLWFLVWVLLFNIL